jgi:hypothetical protein
MQEYMNKKELVVQLTVPELISILKSVLMDRLNVDLDKLDINVIYKYINNRLMITLDTEVLRDKSASQYLQFIQDMKRVFGPYIFTVNTAIDVNILINKLFAGYEYYRINENTTIEIYY